MVTATSEIFSLSLFFFFNDTATTEIYTLSLHDALPISSLTRLPAHVWTITLFSKPSIRTSLSERSEEHTSELQSPCNLVCRLLLEKKKQKTPSTILCIIHIGNRIIS